MKKVLAFALALILTLALGVTAFAQPSSGGVTNVWNFGGDEADFGFRAFPIGYEGSSNGHDTFSDFDMPGGVWDINSENLVILPYDYGDFAMLIDGTDTYAALFEEYDPEIVVNSEGEPTLSSIKVESEKGLIDVTVYKLDDYVKDISGTIPTDSTPDFGIKTKSNWPFEDFDVEDLVEAYGEGFPFYLGKDLKLHLDLFFVYFDFPTYAGAGLSKDNYFTLKFRDNTTGGDNVETSKKVWFCVYSWAVEEEDVENYADEDEAMELTEGVLPFGGVSDDDFLDYLDGEDLYKHVPGYGYVWYVKTDDTMDEDDPLAPLILYGFAGGQQNDPPHLFLIGGSKVPYVITKDAWKEIVGSTLIVGVDDDLEVEIGKIVKGQSGISFVFDTDVDDDIQALDEDAELAALLFLDTADVLDSDFTIGYTFGIEDAAKAGEYFLYELVGDELKLVKKVAVGKGDDEVDVEIERKAGDTLGQYYLSDVELAATAAPSEEEENPNTGAAEVAGVAVALAVVSLVSAAAVALKK
ncbi:MAG: hypothetical protein KBC20_06335 [Oscillospiraceae bacterium]|nr:hypothetical protein [Oscillospiraceae bacterium]